MIWDLIQQYQIDRNTNEIDLAKSRLDRAERDIEKVDPLPIRFERLILVCRAMWELMHEKLGVREEEFLQKVREIDLRDGRLDGKLQIATKQCPSCSKVMNRKHMACIYCGAEGLHDSVFDLV